MCSRAGGGNGWGVRLFGAAVDSVVSMEVVLATEDGAKLTVVDHLNNAELFAGLKGAGVWMFLDCRATLGISVHCLGVCNHNGASKS